MICEHVQLTMESTQPRDISKAMLKFWLYQAEQAKRNYEACTGRLEAGKRANKQAAKDWRESDDVGLGFGGPPKPFSDHEIAHCERRDPILKQQLKEANAMAGYMINYITDAAHPEEEGPFCHD